MAFFVIRLALVLAPVLALIFWLRWRSARKVDPEALAADVKVLTRRLLVLAVITLIAVLSLRLTDDGRKAPAGATYVPPRMENGELVPGRFEDAKDKGDQESSDGQN